MSDRAPQPAGGSAAQPEHGTGSLRILILEDRITDVELMLFELRRAGFTPIHRHVDNALDYSENLSQDLDVILADYTLPQFDALEALRVLQERGLSVPFIVVTGSISEEAAVACMKSGATDYLLKDRLARLGPAIRQALASRGMREAKLRAEEQMRSRNRELSLLNRIIAASAKTGDEREFLQVACTETAGALGAFLAAAILLDEKTGTPVIAAEHSSVAGLSLRGKPFRETWISMGAMLAGLRVPAIANHITDSHPIAALHADFLEHPFRSMAVVPLVVDGSTVGGVGLFSDREGHFTEERATLLGSVADELSSVLSRTRLERDRMRLAAAVEQSADAIMIQDVDGVIGYVNTGFERMVGRPRAEIIGKPSSLLMDVRPDPGLVREIAESIRQGREWRGRMSTRRRDGCPCIADVSFSPVHDRSGRTVNFVMIARDVTEALRLEQRYLQAQKMEAIGRLAGGVAHDFNNLLTSIMGYADLLAERFPPETPAGGEVQQIQTAVERAAALTRQLLLFGRRQVLSPRVVNPNEVVAETAALLQPLLGEGVELETALDPSVRSVLADPGQVGQVVMNLALNARDAMPVGGRIRVTTSNAELTAAQARDLPDCRPGSYAALCVADTGSGIGPDVLPHIFEPFFTTKAEGKGTGLGLATVFAIVRQSGGQIRIQSDVGKGTRVEILLPAAPREARPAAS